MQKKSFFIICIISIIVIFFAVFLLFFNKTKNQSIILRNNYKEQKENDNKERISIKDYFLATSTVDISWLSYVDPKFNYTVDYPRNLHFKQSEDKDVSNVVFLDNSEMWLFNIKTTTTTFTTVDEWMKDQNSKLLKERQLKKIKTLSTSGSDAAILTQSEEVETGPNGMIYKDNIKAVVIYNGLVFEIDHRLFADIFDEDVERMAGSLRFE